MNYEQENCTKTFVPLHNKNTIRFELQINVPDIQNCPFIDIEKTTEQKTEKNYEQILCLNAAHFCYKIFLLGQVIDIHKK